MAVAQKKGEREKWNWHILGISAISALQPYAAKLACISYSWKMFLELYLVAIDK